MVSVLVLVVLMLWPKILVVYLLRMGAAVDVLWCEVQPEGVAIRVTAGYLIVEVTVRVVRTVAVALHGVRLA